MLSGSKRQTLTPAYGMTPENYQPLIFSPLPRMPGQSQLYVLFVPSCPHFEVCFLVNVRQQHVAEGSELIMLVNFHRIESEGRGSITSLDKPLVSLAISANAESRATCPSVEPLSALFLKIVFFVFWFLASAIVCLGSLISQLSSLPQLLMLSLHFYWSFSGFQAICQGVG